jgi:putative peptidoglycan binding protein
MSKYAKLSTQAEFFRRAALYGRQEDFLQHIAPKLGAEPYLKGQIGELIQALDQATGTPEGVNNQDLERLISYFEGVAAQPAIAPSQEMFQAAGDAFGWLYRLYKDRRDPKVANAYAIMAELSKAISPSKAPIVSPELAPRPGSPEAPVNLDAQPPSGGGVLQVPTTTMSAPAVAQKPADPWVAALQRFLKEKGFPLPRYGVDGRFGQETSNALKQWQTQQMAEDPFLKPTGQLDKATVDALSPLIRGYMK